MLKQISSYNDPNVKSNKMYQIRKKILRFSFMFFSFEKDYYRIFRRIQPIL